MKMNEAQIRIILDWKTVFEGTLDVSSLCQHIHAFRLGTKENEKILQNIFGPIKRAEIFIECLLESDVEDIYNQFLGALMKSEENKWLVPVFDERFDLGDLNKALKHSLKMKSICKKVQEWWQREKINLDVSMVVQRSDVFDLRQRELLESQKTQQGNSYATYLLVIMLIRKGPNCLESFCSTLKQCGIQFAEELSDFIEELEKEFSDFTKDKIKSSEEEENRGEPMEVDRHIENATTSELHSGNDMVQEDVSMDTGKTFEDKTEKAEDNTSNNYSSNPNMNDDYNHVSSQLESTPVCGTVQEDPKPIETPMDEPVENEVAVIVEEESKKKVEFRDYQEELAEQAIDGANSLIVAPTGTGKTFVALRVCLDHLNKNGHDAKIIFMVPKVPLVKQQHEVLAEHCSNVDGNHYEVRMISGGDPEIPVKEGILDSQVTVMTPQILVDHLVSYQNAKKSQKDLLNIQELTLLIFDECHHVSKGDPFNKIMNCYFDIKMKKGNNDEKKSAKNLPQILGLTASPGIGPAKTHKKAEDSIKTLLGNLDVTTPPKRVVRCKKSLEEKEVKENTKTISVRRRKDDVFEIAIKTAMDKIEARIKDVCKVNSKECKLTFNAKIQGSQVYEAMVVKFHDDSKKLDSKLSEMLMKYSYNLREYNNALHVYDHVKFLDAKKFIETSLFSRVNKESAVDMELKGIYDEKIKKIIPKPPNPLLTSLKKILAEEFDEKCDSRCMIFVKTRAIADGLVTYIKECEKLEKFELNPSRLTGANAKDDNFGKTKADQDQTIIAFREGRCKVIVATSVGEEGLDIPACNLMITYNYSTNEIGQVQRKGRARAMGSKTIMLAYGDSDIIKREKVNKLRVKLTDTTMDELDKQYREKPNRLKKEIQKIQESKFDERNLERCAADRNILYKQCASIDVWDFQCVGCKTVVTQSDKFRHINEQHHFVVDPEFNKKADFVVDEDKAVVLSNDEILVGRTFCAKKTCRCEWGVRMKYKSCYISVLKIKSFVLVQGDERVTVKKWKNAPFKVTKEVTPEELIQMMPPKLPTEQAHSSSDSEDEDISNML